METLDALSDIDIMIVGDINEDALIENISSLESKFEREINYHIFSDKEFIKRKQEKDSFVSRILSKPTIFLIGNHENIPGIY